MNWGAVKVIDNGDCVILDFQVSGEYSLPVRRMSLRDVSSRVLWEARSESEKPMHIRTATFCVGTVKVTSVLHAAEGKIIYGPDGLDEVTLLKGVKYRLDAGVVSNWRDVTVDFTLHGRHGEDEQGGGNASLEDSLGGFLPPDVSGCRARAGTAFLPLLEVPEFVSSERLGCHWLAGGPA